MSDRRGLSLDIYEPAEDSYLLAQACADEIDGDERVLDVGTGTGYVAASIREETGATVFGIDINPLACTRAASHGIPVLRGDLVSAIDARCVDVVVSNPPYLPTSPEEERSDWLSVAVSGGPTGREVLRRLLADVGRVLRPDGRVYVLVSSLMDVERVRETAGERGFTATEIARDDRFPFEVLSVLRLDRERS